jgi:pyruvate dehydrogenase E2 component (dihydrolipoamide acetyltransferase)
MAEVIKMPRLSDTMEEGVVAKWLKHKGDKVEEGDILAEIETDKATMEFESFYEGTLLHIGIEEGETAPVDTLLAIVGEEGEDISGLLDGGAAEEKPAAESKEEAKQEESAQEESSSEGAEIPEGVEVVKMPRLSDTMEEGTVASWLKQVGDKVEEGDILAEIETDKATMEFESFYEGTLLHIGIQEGETAPVDSVLAIIGPEGTDVSALAKGGAAPAPAKKAEEKEEEKAEEKKPSEAGKSSKDAGRVFASPLAKKMAEDLGIDLNDVKGSGENNRIVKKDIEAYKPSEKPAATKQEAVTEAKEAPSVQAYVPAGEESFEETKNSQMRKTIARRLAESKYSAPHYYLTIEVDMANAMANRKQINELPDVKVSFNDIVIKATSMALRKHPQVNSQWTGDTTKIAKHIHMGVAVAVEEGLVVPVLRFADQMSMTQIGANVKDLAGKARVVRSRFQTLECTVSPNLPVL